MRLPPAERCRRISSGAPFAVLPLLFAAQGGCALLVNLDDYPDAPGGTSSSGTGGGGSSCTAAGGDMAGALQPSKALALGGDTGVAEVTAMAVRPDGRMIAAGFCTDGTVDFRLGAGPEPCLASAETMFLLGLDSSLAPQWRVRVDETSVGTHLYDVAITPDGGGDAIITGRVHSSFILGECFLNNATDDVFVARIGPDGTCRWKMKADGPQVDSGNAIALQDSAVYVAGMFAGSVYFGALPPIMATGTDTSFFLAKIDAATGAVAWAVSLGGNAAQYVKARLAVSPAGDVWVAGSSTTQLLGCTDSVAGGALGFAARLDGSNGAVLAKRCFPATGGGALHIDAIAADALGAGLVGSPVPGTQAVIGEEPIGASQVFAARLNEDASVAWATNLGGAEHQEIPWSIAAMPAGRLIVAGGSYMDVVRTGGGAVGLDAYVVGLSSSGIPQWGDRYGDATADAMQVPLTARALGCGAIVSGTFAASLTPIDLSAPSGARHGFVVALQP